MVKPTMSIVIPVYNEAKLLPQTFEMFHRLSVVVAEIIFVDGGSTDGSRALIEDAGFVCLLSAAGRAKQMNVGGLKSSCDIILFLHIDTSITSSEISSIKKSYVCGYLSGRLNVTLSNKSIKYCFISYFINIRSSYTKVSTGDQAMFMRRDIFRQLGGFADIPLMEDVEMSKRLRRIGKVACLSDKVVTSSRRWEENGIWSTIYLMWKLRFLYWIGVSPTKLAGMYRDAR